MERAVSFRNKKGQRLFGILHLPEITTPLRRIGVNILNPGLKNRVAPNRINVRIARMLCARGFPVLRFDPCGIGDSEGELAEGNELNMDLWGMIQRGAFVPDTLVANDFFVREARLDHLAIIGQCGGAMTAMLAAARDARVHGVILVDLPVRLLSSKLDIAELWLDTRTPDEMFREYLKKIFRARSWLNLVSMRSDFTTMKKVISRRFGARPDRDQPGGATSAGVSDRFLWPLLEACETLLVHLRGERPGDQGVQPGPAPGSQGRGRKLADGCRDARRQGCESYLYRGGLAGGTSRTRRPIHAADGNNPFGFPGIAE